MIAIHQLFIFKMPTYLMFNTRPNPTKEELEGLLSHLSSEETKMKFVYELSIMAGVEVPQEYLERAFEVFKGEGEKRATNAKDSYEKHKARRPYLGRMADIAKKLGRDREAMELFAETYNHKEAAELAEKLGLTEDVIKHYEAIANRDGSLLNGEAMLSHRDDVEKFLKLTEEAGQYERIIKLHLKHRNLDAAVKVAKTHGLVEKVLEELKTEDDKNKSGYRALLNRAGEFAEKAGLTEEALKIYIDVDKEHDVTRLAEKSGKPEIAIEFYKDKGKFHEAISMAKEAGMNKEAEDLQQQLLERLEKKEDWHSLGRLAEEMGLTEKAIEAYEKAGSAINVILIAEKAGMKDKIREIRTKEMLDDENYGLYTSAAEIAAGLGLEEKAKAYEAMAVLTGQEERHKRAISAEMETERRILSRTRTFERTESPYYDGH